jgi:hypothetical protein
LCGANTPLFFFPHGTVFFIFFCQGLLTHFYSSVSLSFDCYFFWKRSPRLGIHGGGGRHVGGGARALGLSKVPSGAADFAINKTTSCRPHERSYVRRSGGGGGGRVDGVGSFHHGT